MPKGKNNWISNTVRAFLVEWRKEHKKKPKPAQVLDAHPEMLNHYDAVRKAIHRNWEKSAPKPPVPELPTAKSLSERLGNVRQLLAQLELRAMQGHVEAHAYDKLVRLERDLVKWLRAEELEKKRGLEADNNPTWAAMMKTFQERSSKGLNDRTEKHAPEPGSQDSEGHGAAERVA